MSPADERDVVEEIVRQLDGIPLAIELAAARTTVLSPQKLLQRLSQRFALLQSRDQDLSLRQRTLSNAIEWSWNLLEPWEQDALAQCSVFRGGFFLESAEEVIDLAAHPNAPLVMDVITDLKDKSLLRTWELPEIQHELRFGMYESIRDFSAAKRLALANPDQVCARHATHMLARGNALLDSLRGDEAHETMTLLGTEVENLVAVADHCPDERGVKAILITAQLLEQIGPYERLRELLDRALVLARPLKDRRLLTAVLSRCCQLNFERTEFEACERDASEGMALADAENDLAQLAQFHACLGQLKTKAGNVAASKQHFDQALELAKQSQSTQTELDALRGLANLALRAGELSTAQRIYRRSSALATGEGYMAAEALVNNSLGWLMKRLGRFEESEQHYRDALEVAQRLQLLVTQVAVGNNLSSLLAHIGRMEEAEQVAQDALERAAQIGMKTHAYTLKVNVAVFAMQREDWARAREMLDVPRMGLEPRLMSWASSLRGFIAGLEGDVAAAKDEVSFAADHAAISNEPITIALADLCCSGLDLAHAQAAVGAGDWDTVQQHIKQIAERMQRMHSPVFDPHAEVQRSAAEQEGDIRFILSLIEPRYEALRDHLVSAEQGAIEQENS